MWSSETSPGQVFLRALSSGHAAPLRWQDCAACTTTDQRVSKDWTWPEELLLGKSGFTVSLCWSRSICWLPSQFLGCWSKVIHARRTFGVSPPNISGPPEFERIFRAQVNSSEYFPIFVALLWQAGLFFHQGLAAALGLLYLYSRYCYFMGYRASSSDRLAPIYFSTGVLWVLVAAATLGLVHFFLCHYVGLNVLRLLAA
ncbi:leukotriene C4 synthase-like isoform X3 [Coturnix japonica]|uniref:leukotriene C4 synthase-like isoform X3 n=1 Tax=Coturnix japonica TaxID=93934 RepID=UPI0007773DB8|nr:leukotriene C4 synthase-like isoform X3 [Coturnix japonica]